MSDKPKKPKPPGDYDVGFGKPPTETRFKKGQSGNPRGRPRKRKPREFVFSDEPTDHFLMRELFRGTKVRENGKEVEYPALNVAIRSLMNLAMKGNRLATQYLLKLTAEKEKEYAAYKLQNYEKLAAEKMRGLRILEQCKRQGTEPPDLLPHPHDIHLNPVTLEARVRGPKTEEEGRAVKHAIRLRDLGFAISLRSNGLDKIAFLKNGKAMIDPLFGLASITNESLPERCRWTHSYMCSLGIKIEGMTKREWRTWIAGEKQWLMENQLPPDPTMPEEFLEALDIATGARPIPPTKKSGNSWLETEGGYFVVSTDFTRRLQSNVI